MEITDQDISDFIKSRGAFTCVKSEPARHRGYPYFYFDPKEGQVWQHNLEIFGIEVWFQTQIHHNGEVLDEMRDNLIKSIINNGDYKQKILRIIKREKKLDLLLKQEEKRFHNWLKQWK